MTCDRCKHWSQEGPVVNDLLSMRICRLTINITVSNKTTFNSRGTNAIPVIATSALNLPDHVLHLETTADFGCNQFEAVSK